MKRRLPTASEVTEHLILRAALPYAHGLHHSAYSLPARTYPFRGPLVSDGGAVQSSCSNSAFVLLLGMSTIWPGF